MKIYHSGILYILQFFLFIWNLLKHFCTVTLCIKLFAFTRLILMFHQLYQQNISFFNKNLHDLHSVLRSSQVYQRNESLKLLKHEGHLFPKLHDSILFVSVLCVDVLSVIFKHSHQQYFTPISWSFLKVVHLTKP